MEAQRQSYRRLLRMHRLKARVIEAARRWREGIEAEEAGDDRLDDDFEQLLAAVADLEEAGG